MRRGRGKFFFGGKCGVWALEEERVKYALT